MVRVRFAPSPTGYLHIGGARTAIFNWLFARQQQGKFLLRIEDTDQQRSGAEMVEAIFSGLRWLGLDWDDEPVLQSSRLEIYQDYAKRLLREGKAFRCFCSPELIYAERERVREAKQQYRYNGHCRSMAAEESESRAEAGEKFTIRFRLPEGETIFHDVLHGDVRVSHEVLDDFIIMRSDGYPTYHLAVVVDDYEMGITHVLRGDDHLSNTPKQVLLYTAFGWDLPEFVHVPLIHGADRRRLSKRHGATAVGDYARQGYLPEALFNYLVLLGWSSGDDREIFSRDELIRLFGFDGLAKNAAIFDEQKLLWLNSQYIAALDGNALFDKVFPLLVEKGYVESDMSGDRRENVIAVLRLLQPRAKLMTDFVAQSDYFFREPAEYEPKGVRKHWQNDALPERLQELAARLEALPEWTEESIERVVRDFADELHVSAAKVIHPVRLALTGRTASPGLFEIMFLLGRETVLQRFKKAVEFIQKNQ